jgi:hypothetical protein
MFFNGLPEMKVSNIQIENVHVTSTYGAELNNSKDIAFKNVYVQPTIGAALILNGVENFMSENFTFPVSLQNPIELKGNKNKDIIISNNRLR